MKVALATCRDLPHWEVDDRPLVAALSAAGVEVMQPAWDDVAFDWSAVAACLIRTTWDYVARRDAFVAWAERAASVTRLFNSSRIVRWNTDKHYLRDLERAGVATIPTIWLRRGTACDIASFVQAQSWDRAFLKPTIGASASGTLRFAADTGGLQDAQRHADMLLRTGDAMLQPYLNRVEVEGEYSAIFVDGRLTHWVRKIPVAGDYRVQDDYGARDERATVDAAAEQAARRAVAAVGEPLLYARADFLRDGQGILRLNELELVEPSLFFRHNHDAAERLASALLRRVTGDASAMNMEHPV